ncbi:MAG: 50S ribosomal protein L7Ae [Methanomassiliicoccales archaeon]
MAKAMHVRFEVPQEVAEKIYQVVELVRDGGKLRKGTNEVTKVVERGEAVLVVMAEDVDPPEILAHMPMLCDEKGIAYAYVPKKSELGTAAGLDKPTASVAITDAGKAKQTIDALVENIRKLKK